MVVKLDVAISEALDLHAGEALNQSAEFKRRYRRLIENALTNNINDSDVSDVIRLIDVDIRVED